MFFKLEINLDNEDFRGNVGSKLATLLGRIASQVSGKAKLSEGDGRKVMDTNGNTVGMWDIKGDEETCEECEMRVPDDAPSDIGPHHAKWCSLHTEKYEDTMGNIVEGHQDDDADAFCQKCGAAWPKGDTVCPSCGVPPSTI